MSATLRTPGITCKLVRGSDVESCAFACNASEKHLSLIQQGMRKKIIFKTCLPDKLANQAAASQQCETFLNVYLRKLSLLVALYGRRVLTVHSTLIGRQSGLTRVPCHLVIPIWQAWSPHAEHLRGWPCSTPLIAHQQFRYISSFRREREMQAKSHNGGVKALDRWADIHIS